MHNHDHDLHLSCGCHNLAADPLIKMAAKAVQSAGTLVAELENAAASAVAAPSTALIVHNGGGQGSIRPLTQGDADATVEAFGVVDGKVVAVGAFVDVKAQVGKHAAGAEIVIQALSAGQCVIPGLIEPHVHIVPTSMMLRWQDYGPFGDQPLNAAEQSQPLQSQVLRQHYSWDKLQDRLKQDVATVKDGEWLLGVGVDASMIYMATDPALMSGKTLLDMLDYGCLDQISMDTPILLASASMHTMYANSKALGLIWDRNENIRAQYKTLDNYISETNGVLQEIPQIAPAIESIAPQQLMQMVASLGGNVDYFFEVARQRGVTMVYDAGMQPAMADLLFAHLAYRRLSGKPERMRIGMAHLVENEAELTNVGSFSPPKAHTPIMHNSIDFYFGSVKLVSDGSNQGLTGYQSEPYCCPPNSYFGINNFVDDGAPRYEPPAHDAPQTLVSLAGNISQKGWPAMIHANGDQSIDYALEVYGKAKEKQGAEKFKALRNRIEHCSLLDDGRLKRITELGVSPSFLIGHVGYWGWAFSDYIFKGKAERQLDRCASTETPFTLHSDCSVSPMGPLRMMEQAVTRKMEGSPQAMSGAAVETIPVLNAAERISPARALRAATYDAAWQCHADHLVGSLEPGKLADFVVLARDPVGMGVDEAYKAMRDIAVQQVWVGGTLC